MIEGKILEIGQQAYDPKEPLVILFGEKVTAGLRPYSIVQQIPQRKKIKLVVGGQLQIGETQYTIENFGRLAEKNLHDFSHTALLFAPPIAEDELLNAIYLSPMQMPQIKVGDKISYPGGDEDGA